MIDLRTVTEVALKVAADMPDETYRKRFQRLRPEQWADFVDTGSERLNVPCEYKTPQGEPLCLVGVVLDRLGLLAEVPDAGAEAFDVEDVARRFTPRAVAVLTDMQWRQDDYQDDPWEGIIRDALGGATEA